jgi:hypothetical protein
MPRFACRGRLHIVFEVVGMWLPACGMVRHGLEGACGMACLENPGLCSAIAPACYAYKTITRI